jgi:hypothetical protein
VSVWGEIEEALDHWEVSVPLNPTERYVVQESMASFVREVMDSQNAWTLIEAMNKVIPGLDPSEAELVKKQGGQKTIVKPGHHGSVVSMDAQSWQAVLKQLERHRDYFASHLTGRGNVDNLIKKIQNSLGMSPGPETDPSLSGNPNDVVPFTPGGATGFNDPSISGEFPNRPQPTDAPPMEPKTPFSKRDDEKEFSPAELGGGVFADDPEQLRRAARERRARVAAQDKAMMGGKTKPVGKVTVR